MLDPIDEYGGLGNVLEIAASGSGSLDYKHYAKIQKNRSIHKHSINHFTKQFKKLAELESEQIREFLMNHLQEIQKIQSQSIQSNVVDFCDLEMPYIQKHEMYLSTKYPSLDRIMGGLGMGHLIVLAARPAVGKTAFACNLAVNVAAEGKKVLFFTREINSVSLARRIISAYSTIDVEKMDQHTYLQWLEKAKKLQIKFDQMDNRINEICQCIKDQHYDNQIDCVVIDYLQLLESNGKAENRNLEVSDYTRKLKTTALDLNIPILCLSQLSRSIETRENPVPRLSDLRDSGGIEQDADVVVFMTEGQFKTNITVAKNRHGCVGQIQLSFKKNIGKFEE